MKSRTIILMVVAVVCGLAASYLTSRLLAERANNEGQVEEEKVKVLVARQNLVAGTYVRDPQKLFVEKEFVKGQEPKKAAKSFDEVKDRLLAKSLSAEQWVSVDDLLKKEDAGIGVKLPKGMRAMTIKVTIDTLVGGFVLPNSRVDVVHTVRRDDKDSYAQIILQNMLVLAVGAVDVRDPEKKHIVDSTVTLAVTPDEAQKLSLAQTMGELRLMLKAPDDNEKVAARTIKPGDLLKGNSGGGGGSGSPGAGDEEPGGGKVPLSVPDVPRAGAEPGPVAEQPAPAAPPRRKTHTLTLINGSETTRAVFVFNDEDEPEIQIQKSQPEREPARPDRAPQAAPAPEPAPPAPAPEKGQPAKGQPGDGGRPAPAQRGTN